MLLNNVMTWRALFLSGVVQEEILVARSLRERGDAIAAADAASAAASAATSSALKGKADAKTQPPSSLKGKAG